MKENNKSQVRLWMAMIGFTFSNVAMNFGKYTIARLPFQLLNFILFYRWTHLDFTHLGIPGMDTCGSTWIGHTWNGHTWTHLDDIYPHGWFKIIRYTWKVRTHLETLNTGAMEPLMDSSRQLLWILPENSYGFFQTTLIDSSRQLLWILPDNSYGFF